MWMLDITRLECQIQKILLRVKMLILVWFVVCIIFAFVHFFLGNSGHALELFALLSAIALILINKIKYKIK